MPSGNIPRVIRRRENFYVFMGLIVRNSVVWKVPSDMVGPELVKVYECDVLLVL